MVFNSVEFLIFFPVVLLLYFILPRKARWVMLLAASYYFYLSWNVELIYLILFTTVISYFSAIIIEKYRSKKHLCRLCFTLTLLASLGVLFFYKYFDFLAGTVFDIAAHFGAEWKRFSLDLILPVGISFYTFQTLSYVIDVYRGTVPAERHFGYYALYVTFFPQLVAGPIERPENLIPQLYAEHKFNKDDFSAGMRMILLGFFKKTVVADLCAGYVVAVYGSPASQNGFSVLVATVLFAFQIYGDFAGYTDIAIGCSRIMGIRLMQNFARPYSAESIKGFWGRWHISLSSWFKDYIYIPLGGNRVSFFRGCMNIMIVFLVSGLWHGAAWTFVLWGAIHGLYQVIGKLTIKRRTRFWRILGLEDSAFLHAIRKFNTFVLVDFAWIFFRADSFGDLKILLSKLFTDWSFSAEYFKAGISNLGIDAVGAIIAVISIIIMDRADVTKLEPKRTLIIDGDGSTREIGNSSAAYIYVVWAIVFAWLMLLVGNGASSFIYFQF